MKPDLLLRAVAAAALVASAASAPAADFTFAGNAVFNTDIVALNFTLAADTAGVRVWTDSWQSGLNYDPTLAVWAQAGSDYTLLGEVDDDDSVGPGQGSFDAGLFFASLAAGQYRVTLAASPNYANGSRLSDGFLFDGSVPIPIALWDQPGHDINKDDQKGTFWRVNLTDVSQASVVPEPSTWALLALSLGVVAWRSRRPASALS